MPNIRQIRTHVAAVDSARTITKALQMISASRLQRVQRRRVASREATTGADEIAAAAIRVGGEIAHPLLCAGAGDVSRVIVLGSDRGMCGGYNSRVVQAAIEAADELARIQRKCEFHAIGKRVGMALRERLAARVAEGASVPPMTGRPGLDESRMLDEVAQLARKLCDDFIGTPLASVSLVRMRLGGQGAVTPVVSQLLPLEAGPAVVSIYTQYQPLPDAGCVLEVAVPQAVRMRLYHAFLEAALSEHTARLMAMKAATSNAEDMIRDLTREMNRARQARITAELSEIVGGADAVEGVR